MRRLVVALLIFGCTRDDDAEQERTACEAFFVAVDPCIDTCSAEHTTDLPPELLCAGNGYIEFTHPPERFCGPLA
jgi:hypothetical protein